VLVVEPEVEPVFPDGVGAVRGPGQVVGEIGAEPLDCGSRPLQRRLERGRELLRMRLSRRGLTLSIGLLATSLSEQAASAALPAGLLNLTVKAALLHAAGKATAAGLISAHAAVLAKGVLQAMFISKLTTLTTMVLAVGVTITGAGLWTYHSPAAQRTDAKEKKAVAPAIERGAESPALVGVPSQTDPKEKKAAGPASERGEELPALIRVPSQRDGIVRVIGTEIKEGEKVPPGQTITVKVDGEKRKYRRLKKGDSVEEAQLLALLDDDLARAEVDIKVAKVNSARAECRAAEKTRDEALARYETAKKLVGAGDKLAAISKEDLRGALLTFSRYFEEALSKAEAINVAEQELKQARKVLEMHEIRSPSPGVIRAIHKRPGEAVKYLEAVFLIQVPEE